MSIPYLTCTVLSLLVCRVEHQRKAQEKKKTSNGRPCHPAQISQGNYVFVFLRVTLNGLSQKGTTHRGMLHLACDIEVFNLFTPVVK